ncbi:MAG: nucleotidyltransferase family protein [Acidobacteriota bacterium]
MRDPGERFRDENLIVDLLAGRVGKIRPPRSRARFLDLCRAHGVEALLLEKLRLRGARGEAWDRILKELESARRQNIARNIYLLSRLRELQSILRKAGIPLIVLKGGCLLSVLYPDFGNRPLGDVDLLIRKRNLDRVLGLMRAAGWRLPPRESVDFWRKNFYHVQIRTPDAFSAIFEIHWDLEKEYRHDIQLEELWERSVIFQLEGEPFRRLSNEDLMLHLLVHLAHHFFHPRLIWVYDIRLLAEVASVDWSRVHARAERWRLRLPVFYSLAYVEKVFPDLLPSEVIQTAKVSRFRRGILQAASTADPLTLTLPMERAFLRLPFSLYFIGRQGDILKFLWRNLGSKILPGSPGRNPGQS